MHWTLQNTVWIAGIALESTIAVNVLYQRLWHSYPVFVSYILCEIARSLLLFAIGPGPAHYATYFYTYWITECIVALLGFVVVREIFSKALSAQFGLQRWGATLFWSALTILIVIAVLAALDAKVGDPSKVLAAIFLIKRVESLVRLGLVVALFVFVFILGTAWADPVIGIAAGFGLYGAGELVAYGIRSSWGPRGGNISDWIRMGINLCQKILWLAYFFPWRKTVGKVDVNDALGAKSELEKLHDAIEVILER